MQANATCQRVSRNEGREPARWQWGASESARTTKPMREGDNRASGKGGAARRDEECHVTLGNEPEVTSACRAWLGEQTESRNTSIADNTAKNTATRDFR